jgi:hypothetical protein
LDTSLRKPTAEYLAPVIFSIASSAIVGWLARLSGSIGSQTLDVFFGQLTVTTVLVVAVGALVGVFAASMFQLALAKRPLIGKAVVASVLAPTSAVLTIVAGHIVLSVFLQGSVMLQTALVLVTLMSLYTAVFSFIFIITDILSDRARNLLYSVYGSFLGALFGVVMPTLLLFVVIAIAASYDAALFRTGFATRLLVPGSIKHERALSSVSIRTASLDLGLGELIFHSMIPAHVLASYGIYTGLFAAALVLAGAAFNARLLSRRDMISGLAVPLLPGMLLLAVLLII